MAGKRTFQLGPVKVSATTGGPAPKERLSSARIADVALRQMAEKGYDAVSMRSVARELGTGPASLYAHVASRDVLDQLVLDRIAEQVHVPEPDPGQWRDQVRQVLRDMLAAYRAHPGSARAALATIPTMEGGLRVAEGMMALLVAGGIRPQAAAWFVDLSALYVSGIGAEESIWDDRRKAAESVGIQVDVEELIAEIHRVYASLPAATYPMLASLADVMTSGDGEERFEFGLDVLIAGLEVVSARMR